MSASEREFVVVIGEVLSVSSQVEQIQALIAQIDLVLDSSDPDLPPTDEHQAQRQVLEQVRQYLAAQPATLSVAPALPTSFPAPTGQATTTPTVEQSLQQFAQSLAALHANLLGPPASRSSIVAAPASGFN